MKTIPNIITSIRIVIAFLLLLFHPGTIIFRSLYITAGVSDLLDGYIARKMKSETYFGSKLDSLADLIFCGIVIYKMIPIIHFDKYVFQMACIIVVIRLISVVLCKTKFNQMAMMHTMGNKFAGIMLFMYLFIMNSKISSLYQYLLCLAALISALEEFIIHISSNKLILDKKFYWQK